MKTWVETIPHVISRGKITPTVPEDEKIHPLSYYFLDRAEAEKADVVIFGVPYDGALPPQWEVSTRLGPQAIRKQLGAFRTYSHDLKIDISSVLKIVDVGDLDVVYNTPEVLKRIETVVSEILKKKKMPIMFGGDHTNTYGGIKGLCSQTKGDVGVISFDAHLDLMEIYHGDPWYDGCPFRRVLEIGGVKPKNLVCIGPRGFVNPFESGWKFVEEVGVNVFTVEDIDQQGIVSVVEKAIDLAKDGTEAVYLSVDIDALDSASAPGHAWPCPGGLTNRELLKAVRMISLAGVSAFDVMEVGTQNDPAGATALMGAALTMEIMGGLAKIRQRTG